MNKCIYIIFILCLPFGTKLMGQDTTRQLDPVPVFAKNDSITRLTNIQASIPHYILNEEKIDALGALDAGDALKVVPGALVKDYGGIGGIKTIAYRGLGAGHTNVQVDGQQIPNLQSGVVNLSNFELFGVEQVDFSTGQTMSDQAVASSFVQANSIAIQSVLNSTPNKRRLGIYSNSNTIRAFEKGLYYQEKLGKNFFIGGQGMMRFGEGTYYFKHPEIKKDTLLKRENTALNDYRIRGVFGYETKLMKILVGGYYRNSEQELPGAAVLFNPSNDQNLWNVDWRTNTEINVRKGKWAGKVHGNYQSNYTRYYDPFYLNLDGFIDARYQQENATTGLVLSRRFRFPNERIFVATDFTNAKLFGNGITNSPKRLQMVNVIGGSTLFNKLKLDGNLTQQIIRDDFLVDDQLEERSFLRFSPFVSLAYRPFSKQRLRLRMFYKNTFRMPTFNDLYYNFIGNIDLKPEDAQLYNIGITYSKAFNNWGVESSIDGYFNTVKNKIVAIPTKDLFNWSMQNIGAAEIKGIDLNMLVYYESNNWKLNISTNHNFNSSVDITNQNSITYLDQIPYTPFYTSSSSTSVDYKSYSLSINVLYTGYRYSLNENIYANYLEPFTAMNIGVAKGFTFEKSKLKASLRVMNLFNVNYQVVRSFPMPGRYWQFKIHYKLNQ